MTRVIGVVGALLMVVMALPAIGGPLQAGAAAVDVTPPQEWLPIAVNGGFTARFLETVNDPLHVKAIVLSDGETAIVLSTVDSCVLDRALIDDAKQRAEEATGIPTSRMLVSATHTHSAPAVVGVHGTDADERYRTFLTEKIAEAIVQAHARLEPAEAGWAVTECPEWVHVRRWLMKPGTALTVPFTGASENLAQMNPGHDNPNKIRQTGPRDTAVTLLAIRSADQKPLAVYANYSTHYAGAPNISADYFAVFGEEMRRLMGAGEEFVGIMSNGTSGDANCIDFTQPRRTFTHTQVGQEIAAKAYETYQTIEFSREVSLSAAEATLTLNVRMPTAEEVHLAREFLAKEVGDRLPRNMPESYARETVILSEMPPTRELKLQAYRIGELGMAALPTETYGITGLAIKKASPLRPTLVVGLANGWDGYLPPPDQHALGGYTTWRSRASCLEVDAEPKIREILINLLNEVADAP
jgi:neutral ceramidase